MSEAGTELKRCSVPQDGAVIALKLSVIKPKPNQTDYFPIRLPTQSQKVVKPKPKPKKLPDYFRHSIQNRSGESISFVELLNACRVL